MPFDSTPSVPAVSLKPDLSKPSLAGLSWLLRHPEEWPRYASMESKTVPSKNHDTLAISISQSYFGLPTEAAKRLFTIKGGGYGDGENVTPIDVADAIDAYLAKRGAA